MAEVAQAVGQVGIAKLLRRRPMHWPGPSRRGRPRRRGKSRVCVEADAPKVAVIVAWSSVFNGVEAAGVSMTVSVVDWPTARFTGVKPVRVRPLGVVAESETLLSATLPTLVIVIVSASGRRPGSCSPPSGCWSAVTASIAGTVNVTVWVWVIDESVVLVAVTWKDRTVPGSRERLAGVRYEIDARESPSRRRDGHAGAAIFERESTRDVRRTSGCKCRPLGRGSGSWRGRPWGAARRRRDGELRIGRDGEVDARLRRRDRHVDDRLSDEVGVGLRLGDNLDRVRAALEPGAGVAVTVAVGVDADRPAGRGVGRESVGVGEARLDGRSRT